MARPPRRTRRLLQSTEVVGILPAEEAALNKALFASLQEEKTVPQSNETCKSSPRKPLPHSEDVFATPTKRRRTDLIEDTPSPLSSYFPSVNPFLSRSVSPHYSVATLSSSISSPASIDSSLKLILSTSSWTSSNESEWSPTPVQSPVVAPPAVKRGRGRPRKYPKVDAPSQAGSKPAVKLTASSASPKVTRSTSNKTSPKNSSGETSTKSKTPSTIAGRNNKKITPEKSQTKTTPNKGKIKASPKSGSKTENRKKQPAATSTPSRPTTTSSSDNPQPPAGSQAVDKEDSSSTASSPCTLKAQRKFAQNHIQSPQSQLLDDTGESAGRKVKEIPRTEDFITFLCLRSSVKVPQRLDMFNTPWSGVKKLTTRKISKSKNELSAIPKKLDFTPKPHTISLDAKPPVIQV